MSEKEILELIFTAQVVLLSRDIDREKKQKGTHRVGGDYVQEAVKLIKKHHDKVFKLRRELG